MVKGKVIEEEIEEEEIEEDEIEEEDDEEVEDEEMEEEVPDIEPKKSSGERERNIGKPKAGDILSYTKEFDSYVLDEKGNRIPCKNLAEAKMLSLLFEIKSLCRRRK
ncbi:MAG TPA: hypothetical protein VMV95_00485 [Bacillota bacterium]|nr:hypothetical protein [Bacillota bacterium]